MIITVRGMPRSKKNSKQIVRRGKFSSLVSSKGYAAWAESAILQLKHSKPWTGGYPVYAHYTFCVDSRMKFDLSNMCEGINDIMQTVGIIEDDDYNHLVPVFHGNFCGVKIDKENPRLVVMLADEPLTK